MDGQADALAHPAARSVHGRDADHVRPARERQEGRGAPRSHTVRRAQEEHDGHVGRRVRRRALPPVWQRDHGAVDVGRAAHRQQLAHAARLLGRRERLRSQSSRRGARPRAHRDGHALRQRACARVRVRRQGRGPPARGHRRQDSLQVPDADGRHRRRGARRLERHPQDGDGGQQGHAHQPVADMRLRRAAVGRGPARLRREGRTDALALRLRRSEPRGPRLRRELVRARPQRVRVLLPRDGRARGPGRHRGQDGHDGCAAALPARRIVADASLTALRPPPPRAQATFSADR